MPYLLKTSEDLLYYQLSRKKSFHLKAIYFSFLLTEEHACSDMINGFNKDIISIYHGRFPNRNISLKYFPSLAQQ